MLRAKLDGSSEGNTLRGVMVPQRNKDRFPHCKTAFYIVQFAIATRPVVALPAPSIDQCSRRKLIRVNVKTGPSRQLQRSVMDFASSRETRCAQKQPCPNAPRQDPAGC
ncbi:MAG TPA: hypothetical protein PK752_19425 [Accumulibacter sp.]|uniref:hypothetical protein n=1 Tax=Accumulibacter sp. TaxID=2053492 RepID=UPI002B9D2F24|nr:hypothetical protein [Accumulibacter sp.]HRD90402.1 hypothetical protein [Accumulibacter sp.]